MSKLNEKQKLFVREYLLDLHATNAAIRAGYSKRTAGRQGPRLLKNPAVQAYLQKQGAKRAKRLDIKADDVLQSIANDAYFDIRKLFDKHSNLLAVQDLDDDTARLICGIDVNTQKDKDGNITVITKIKLPDRLKAKEMLGKHLKLFSDNNINLGEGATLIIEGR